MLLSFRFNTIFITRINIYTRVRRNTVASLVASKFSYVIFTNICDLPNWNKTARDPPGVPRTPHAELYSEGLLFRDSLLIMAKVAVQP